MILHLYQNIGGHIAMALYMLEGLGYLTLWVMASIMFLFGYFLFGGRK